MNFTDAAVRLNRKLGRLTGWQLKRYVPDLAEARVSLMNATQPNLILDGGANRGQWATEVREAGISTPIVSVEPISDNFSHLSKLQLSQHTLEKVALSSREGEVEMSVASNIGMSSSIGAPLEHFNELFPSVEFTRTERVNTVTLDSLEHLKGKRVYLKLDLEGHEWDALHGASRLLGETKEVVALEIETSIRPSHAGEKSHYEIVDYLSSFGFRPFHIFAPAVRTSGEMNALDCLLIRDLQ